MPLSFPYYVSIKDNCCISYFGHNTEYIAQLKILRPLIQEQFNDLKIWLSCNDNLLYLIEDEPNIISRTKLLSNKRIFGHIDEIKCPFDKDHPIEKYFKKLDINIKSMCNKSNSVSKICVISDQCVLPNKPLHYDNIIKYIRSKGFLIKEFTNLKDLESCGWVVGIENGITYLAANKGIKTTLIPTGIGTDLFKTLFPSAEVLSLDV